MDRKQISKRMVVKVGSQVLCDLNGELNTPVLDGLAMQISSLSEQGWQIVLVSSGAVAAGTGLLKSEPGAEKLGDIVNPVTRKQALAAAGQVRLMETWRKQFKIRNKTVAQVLTSRGDFQTRQHYLNMRTCIEALLDCGVIPIVNENDVVAVTELMFTDNDELAGLLAGMIGADMLYLLSTVPGVLEPASDQSSSTHIEQWNDDKHDMEELVRTGTSSLGRGGMHSKIAIARKTAGLGTDVVIADGSVENILLDLCGDTAKGTHFPRNREASPTKRWLASAQAHSSGSVCVNAGAESALLDQNRLASLLPIGITDIKGPFERGDVIQILNESGDVLGCGRARYDHHEAQKRLGQHAQKPLIHYDYLYLNELKK